MESADKYHMFTRKHYQVFEWTNERAKSVNYDKGLNSDTGLKWTRSPRGLKILFGEKKWFSTFLS